MKLTAHNSPVTMVTSALKERTPASTLHEALVSKAIAIGTDITLLSHMLRYIPFSSKFTLLLAGMRMRSLLTRYNGLDNRSDAESATHDSSVAIGYVLHPSADRVFIESLSSSKDKWLIMNNIFMKDIMSGAYATDQYDQDLSLKWNRNLIINTIETLWINDKTTLFLCSNGAVFLSKDVSKPIERRFTTTFVAYSYYTLIARLMM